MDILLPMRRIVRFWLNYLELHDLDNVRELDVAVIRREQTKRKQRVLLDELPMVRAKAYKPDGSPLCYSIVSLRRFQYDVDRRRIVG